MVDPLKATKGRRMSKKTRKKSSKTPIGKATLARSKTSSKTPPAKARKPAAKKTAAKASKPTAGASPKASHKAASKTLKLPAPKKSARVAVGSKPAVAKPETKKPPAAKTATVTAGVPPAAKEAFGEGAKAPAFRLPRDGGDTVSLADFAGKRLVLFFYPRADTPGCTREAIDFTRLSTAFAESQTAVLGVSADPPKAQEAFRDKHQLGVPLVSDEKHEMLHAYGVWGEKSMYGRTFQGIVRTTVLIGANGRIARIWRHVKVDGHADEVLAAARSL
jgi:thioredoxin-dependent peroxiredoxin